jgi:hypothetical protein
MRPIATLLISLLAPTALGLAVPLRSLKNAGERESPLFLILYLGSPFCVVHVAHVQCLTPSSSSSVSAPKRSPPSATVADRSPTVEGAGKSGGDDDDAIAYAWYDEDGEAA